MIEQKSQVWKLELIKASTGEFYARYLPEGQCGQLYPGIPTNHSLIDVFVQGDDEKDSTFLERVETKCKKMGIERIVNFNKK